MKLIQKKRPAKAGQYFQAVVNVLKFFRIRIACGFSFGLDLVWFFLGLGFSFGFF